MKINRALCLLVATMLISCVDSDSPSINPEVSNTSISTSTTPVSASSSFTAIPSTTTTATANPTPTFGLPTSRPPSNDNVLHLDTILFEDSFVPNCALPCWRGLVLNQSTLDDIKYVFDSSFGPNGENNVGLASLTVQEISDKPVLLSYFWSVEGDTNVGDFSVVATLDPDTHRLDSLRFRGNVSGASDIELQLSPEIVVDVLGKPDQMFGHAEILGTIREGLGELVLVYNQKGLVFYFYQDISTQVSFDSSLTNVVEDIFPYCIGKTGAIDKERIHAELLIVAPLEDALEKLSTRQKELILSPNIISRLLPLEDIFNVTDEEFMQLALRGNNTCLKSKNLWGN